MKKLYRTKKSVLMMFLLAMVLGVSACGTASTPATTTSMAATTAAETTMAGETIMESETPMAGEQIFNKEELAKFNGKDGQPAYVAVEGVVYDVTNYPLWKNGEHNGMVAGVDQTEGIKKSPHGPPIFDKKSVPVVGTYVE